jgi:hypothetical protein
MITNLEVSFKLRQLLINSVLQQGKVLTDGSKPKISLRTRNEDTLIL